MDRIRNSRTVTYQPSSPSPTLSRRVASRTPSNALAGMESHSYRPLQMHEGIDLLADEGTPVFAARDGEVVRVTGDAADQDRWVAIRHVERGGAGFCTRYLHLKDIVVRPANEVAAGELIGFVGPGATDHLHFEIHAIVNTEAPNDWHQINTELIDPLPAMYHWEKVYFEEIEDENPSAGPAAKLLEASAVRWRGVPFLQLKHRNTYFVVPMWEPDAADTQLIETLRTAYLHGKDVRLVYRRSPFFDDRLIVTEARVVN